MTVKGADAEALAGNHLQQAGLTILERNYRCRLGEIDLIARDGTTLVFVEVRQRSSPAFGGAAASITASKRQRVTRAARHYLSGLGTAPPCRFDVVLIEGPAATVDWIRGAFDE